MSRWVLPPPIACLRWKMAFDDAPASRAVPSLMRVSMPCVIQVRSKNASPPPSASMSASSCSTWSLSVIDSAFGCSAQASLTVFMTHGPPVEGRRGGPRTARLQARALLSGLVRRLPERQAPVAVTFGYGHCARDAFHHLYEEHARSHGRGEDGDAVVGESPGSAQAGAEHLIDELNHERGDRLGRVVRIAFLLLSRVVPSQEVLVEFDVDVGTAVLHKGRPVGGSDDLAQRVLVRPPVQRDSPAEMLELEVTDPGSPDVNRVIRPSAQLLEADLAGGNRVSVRTVGLFARSRSLAGRGADPPDSRPG